MSKPLRLISITLLASVLVLVPIIVYMFDPSTTPWMPRCVFHSLTGLQCPSCGNTRALYHIMHGHLSQGISYNPFILVSWPTLAVVAAIAAIKPGLMRRRWFSAVLGGYVAIYIAWWVVRNIIGI